MIDVEDPGHRFVSLTTLLFAGRRSECRQRLARHLIGEVEDARGVVFPDHLFRGVRMLQITVTVSANHEKVMEEAQILELEGIAKIHEHTSTLILNVPDQQNDEKVIAALAKLARQGLVTEFIRQG